MDINYHAHQTPQFRVLSDQQIEKVYQATLECLNRTGVEVRNAEALELLVAAGARVDGTRVTLDTIVAAFEEGATAEEIVYQYPSLGLAAVYSIVGYYLQHRQEVEAYLLQRRQKINQVREQNQAQFDPRGIRDRLLARRAAEGRE